MSDNTFWNISMMERRRYKVFFLSVLIPVFLLAGCQSWNECQGTSEEFPPIYPDYVGVTVPPNIAPLNFMVEDADRVQVSFCVDGNPLARAVGKDGVVSVDPDDWKLMLGKASGGSLKVQVSVWNPSFPEGISYKAFDIYVSEDEIDPWIAYRLIEPGYEGWRQLGLYQRNLSTFEESAIVTNKDVTLTCVNCHHFPAYSSESMMFHARGKNGGTILYHNGELTKIDFRSIGLKKNTTYPAWHPDGRFIAFSSNTTHQIFYAEGVQQVEVFDTASDLVLYDTQTGEALTDPRFISEDELETFPAWSPDGKYLYFASYKAPELPVRFSDDMHYDLLRVSFDPQTRTFGERIDTLYNTRTMGGSTSYPRISADGRYLLYTWTQYGTFPIWHNEADLKMLDLETMAPVDVSVWNDPDNAESYHSWSSNGRWVMFGSRRLDGRFTRLFIACFDADGRPHKPFLLPQEDPRHNVWRFKSFNVPEFIDGKVELSKDAEKLFYHED
jgi:hypothetical protein